MRSSTADEDITVETTHRLVNIPQEIQKRYNIGPTCEVQADGSVGGGHFTLINNDGGTVSVDAVELSGTGIKIEAI